MANANSTLAPKVGVIIPTHNRLHSLPASLTSVLNQTWRDFEVLIVDDASTDNTAEWVLGLANPRVRLLRLPECRGAGGARNAGIHAIRNEWVAFQDSDDLWHPDKLEKQMRALEDANGRAGFVYCRCNRATAGKSQVFPPPHAGPLTGDISETILGGNLVSTQTPVVRRSYLAACGDFNAALAPLEDWEYFIRLSRLTQAAFVDEVLVEAPFSADSISNRNHDFIAAFRQILNLYASDFSKRPLLCARHLSTIADRLCRCGRWNEARRDYFRAFRLAPSRPRYAAGALLACCPPIWRAVRRQLDKSGI